MYNENAYEYKSTLCYADPTVRHAWQRNRAYADIHVVGTKAIVSCVELMNIADLENCENETEK